MDAIVSHRFGVANGSRPFTRPETLTATTTFLPIRSAIYSPNPTTNRPDPRVIHFFVCLFGGGGGERFSYHLNITSFFLGDNTHFLCFQHFPQCLCENHDPPPLPPPPLPINSITLTSQTRSLARSRTFRQVQKKNVLTLFPLISYLLTLVMFCGVRHFLFSAPVPAAKRCMT